MSSQAVDITAEGSESSIEHLAAEPDDVLDKMDKKLASVLNNTNTMPSVAKRTLANNLKRKPEAPPCEDNQNKKLKSKVLSIISSNRFSMVLDASKLFL
ncbi:hypothetical protein TELCIR_15590 [Teladorsagia circumcincta]|uniref:Uncharacterized protein n=1 Tax=Teladorsagia circumcincta TaxID=45464 RepID=A0A2G9TY18_TELCI|nr:hypothetical protein TELCIR_15590 [Teladorsagia circumcincta]